MLQEQLLQIDAWLAQTDADDVTNLEKTRKANVIRRLPSTDKSKSYEEAGSDSAGAGATNPANADVTAAHDHADASYPTGVIVRDSKLIGLGIHILNEDVYPLQSFEIYLRNLDLTGSLNLDDCTELIFTDLYYNALSAISLRNMPALRILGVQHNQLTSLNPTELPACQGIDAGFNRLTSIDVSHNPQLVELYINDNEITGEVDLSRNPLLKYFYCHNNHISSVDTTANPLLRHLDCTGNPLTSVRAFAPQREGRLPLELNASEGGYVGLRFKPIYNAQWKETGEWEQSYHAMPLEGWRFEGWFEEGVLASAEPNWQDVYGTSHVLTARFCREDSETDRHINTLMSRRAEAGIAALREAGYTVTPVDPDEFAIFDIGGNVHRAIPYNIEGVGSLLVLHVDNPGKVHLDTFSITPYNKSLPLFTTDYIYMGEKRHCLHEIYSLVPEEQAASAEYEAWIERFRANGEAYEDLPSQPLKVTWSEPIRPYYFSKRYDEAEDEHMLAAFLENLRVFIEMEQAAPALTNEERASKWQLNYDYARRLVEDGGPATDGVKAVLGPERTKRFFYEIFFAPHRFK